MLIFYCLGNFDLSEFRIILNYLKDCNLFFLLKICIYFPYFFIKNSCTFVAAAPGSEVSVIYSWYICISRASFSR